MLTTKPCCDVDGTSSNCVMSALKDTRITEEDHGLGGLGPLIQRWIHDVTDDQSIPGLRDEA